MIKAIQNVNNITTGTTYNNKISTNAINYNSYKTNEIAKDTFQANVSFKGEKLFTDEYKKEEIEFAKSKMDQTDDKWKLDLYRKIYEDLLLHRKPYDVQTRGGGKTQFDPNNPVERFLLGIFTLGLTELMVQIENMGFRKEAKDSVKKMEILRAELQNLKMKEEVAEAQKAEEFSKHKLEYLKKLNDVKEKQMNPKLLDLIQREREGRPTDMPNCIMLSNKNDTINNELIKWAGENVNGRFISIKNGDDILAHLEEAEENYQNTGDWNLIYVKDMDKLIDHNEVKSRIVEGMKDIMSSAAEDYHSTLIFSSTHPETLDKIALQTHRVKKIDTKGIITPEDMSVENAKQRAVDLKAAKTTPISTINDLLTAAKADSSLKLNWNHTPEQLKAIDDFIKEKFSDKEDKKYLKAYNTCLQHLV